ncbi:MAG: hypothetical protein OXU23_02280 [Candidatus Poribacteria bacterium]|nr:hypothetical protein [Candidatus Poribacteria bacterium]
MQEQTDLAPENNSQTAIPAMQPMSFTDILDGMFTLYRSHFRLFMGIAVVYLVVGFCMNQIYMYLTIEGGMQYSLTIFFGYFLGVFLLSLSVGGSLIYASAHAFLKRDITSGDALKQTLQRFLSLFGSAFLWILTVFGLFITIIGIPFSIYFGVRWGLYSLPVLFEKTSATKALKRSTELVKGTWGRVFGIMLAIFLITVMIGFILQTSFWAIFNSIAGPTVAEEAAAEPTFLETILLFFAPTPKDIGWAAYTVRNFFTLCISTLLMPIGSVGSALLYFDMRIRKEAYDLEMQVQIKEFTAHFPKRYMRTEMADDRRTKFVGTIFTLYRNNFGLFWRIMIPVAIIAILLDIAMFFRSVDAIEKHVDDKPDDTATAILNTTYGIVPKVYMPDLFRTLEYLPPNRVKDTRSSSDVIWQFFPIPFVGAMNDDDKSSWQWTLNFRTYDYYTPLTLMLLTLCPLSFVVARLSSNSRFSDKTSLTAREAWRQTGKKAFKLLGAFVLFVLIVDVGNYIQIGITLLIPSLMESFSIPLITTLVMLISIYLLVTLSLYNPCLILENRSIIGIFKRSHALVSSARFRFLWIYLLTGWIAAVFTSVLLGAVLFLFSVFFSELAPIREALTPLKFLSLFIGGNVAVELPNLPSILPTVSLLIVKGIITAFLFPVWAIVTTRLYLERVENIAEANQEA